MLVTLFDGLVPLPEPGWDSAISGPGVRPLDRLSEKAEP